MYKEKVNINKENLNELIKILKIRDEERSKLKNADSLIDNTLDITINEQNIERNKLPKIVFNEENSDAEVSLKNAKKSVKINADGNLRPRIKNFKKYNTDIAKNLKESNLILIDLGGSIIEDVDLTEFDLGNINFEWTTFSNVNLGKAKINNSIIDNSAFPGTSLREISIQNSSMKGCIMRHCDLSNADISGTNIFSTVLEYTKLTDVKYDENTRFFELYPPASGPYIGYKKCFNQRVATLLIPADAMRTSATMNCGRCSKAKVLTIKSFDETEEYEYGLATIDEEFEYRVGQYVHVDDFNKNRWMDSTTGIHFWLTREEAIAY